MNKHEFALYYPLLSDYVIAGSMTLHIADKELCHRISAVLRFQPGQTVIMFDKKIYVTLNLVAVDRKSVTGAIVAIAKNKSLAPDITMLVPLIKKDSLETLFYHFVELGVTNYRIVTSQKTQRAWGGQKEQARLESIMIAAAEQSKNFYIPEPLGDPKPLATVLADFNQKSTLYKKIFFDVDGQPIAAHFSGTSPVENKFLITVGPEGDYTSDEKEMLKAHQFTTLKLTPTVLRSWQAATLGIGLLRSFFND